MATQAGVTSNGTKPSTFTLDVKNLPLDLEKAGVLSIFNDYGKVTGIILFKTPNKQSNQAYISYSTYSEAEQAFSALHETEPLVLSIKFKESHLKNLQQQEKINVDLAVPFVDHRYNKSHLDDNADQKKAIDMGKPNCTASPLDTKTYSSDDELLYPIPTDPYTFNPYGSRIKGEKGPYHETNLMYTRGNVTVTEDGRRHIGYGRGYTFYELPEPHLNIGDLVQKVCERREKGLYEYAEEDTEDEIKNCKICSTPTAFKCQKCGIAFYCSKPCQIKDWPGHKLDCQPVPPLIKKLIKSAPPVQNGQKTIVPPHESDLPAPTALRHPKVQPESVNQEVHLLSPPNKENHEKQQQHRQQSQAQTDHQQQYKQQTQPQPIYQQQHRQQNQPQPIHQHQQRQQTQAQPVKQQQSPLQEIKGRANQQPAPELKQEKAVPMQSSPKQTRNINNNSNSNENKNDFNKQKQDYNFKADSSSFPAKLQQQQQQNQNQQKVIQQPTQNQQKVTPKVNEDNFTFQSYTFIPKDELVKVIITSVVDKGQGIYYVQKYEDWDQITELTKKIKIHAEQQKLVKAENNVMCIAKDDGVWYRVKIIKLDDRTMHVFCLDFGVYEDIPVHMVCPINGFEEIPFFSKRIQVKENSNERLKNLIDGNELLVKAVNLAEDGTIIVEAKEVPCEQQTTVVAPPPPTNSELISEKFRSLPNILETLKINDVGFVIISGQLSLREYGVSIVPSNKTEDFQELLGALANDCEAQVQKYPSFSPKVGELVCGKIINDWFRGIVFTTEPVIKLAFIDDCRIMSPSVCTPIPEKYRTMATFGLVLKYLPNTKIPSDLENANYVVTETVNKTKDSVLIKINSDDGKFSASGSLKKWIPKAEQNSLPWAKLNSGHEVKIMDFSNPNVFFVRSLEARELERTQRLDQDVAECLQNKKALTECPIVGEIILAYFDLDKNYYRAIVTCIDDDNERMEIRYIDYGNTYKVTLKDLYELPENLKHQPSCVAKIKLKNIPEEPLNNDANSYIQDLIGNEATLICTFTGHPLENGVELKLSVNNEVVNTKLLQLLKPSWKKESSPDDKVVYIREDCPSLKLGDIGDQVKALPLAYYIQSNLVMMGPNDYVAVEAQEQLDNRIQEYVKTTDTHYIPRENELCIAKYLDNYYRAMCLVPSASPTQCRVFFIDWGNTELVEHKDVRLITKDFLSVNAFVTPCSLSTICTEDGEHDKVRQRINDILEINEPIDIKLIEYDDTDVLIIDIPKLRAQLLEERLI